MPKSAKPSRAAEIVKMAAELRKLGVRSFEGDGVKLEFGPVTVEAAQAPARAPAPRDPEFPDVDPDLFGHEARS